MSKTRIVLNVAGWFWLGYAAALALIAWGVLQ